jgi:hypothetical protein
LVAGRLTRRTGLGCFAAYVALVPVVHRVHGRRAALFAGAITVPMFAKRIAGNHRPATWDTPTIVSRLLFDHDPGEAA